VELIALVSLIALSFFVFCFARAALYDRTYLAIVLATFCVSALFGLAYGVSAGVRGWVEHTTLFPAILQWPEAYWTPQSFGACLVSFLISVAKVMVMLASWLRCVAYTPPTPQPDVTEFDRDDIGSAVIVTFLLLCATASSMAAIGRIARYLLTVACGK